MQSSSKGSTIKILVIGKSASKVDPLNRTGGEMITSKCTNIILALIVLPCIFAASKGQVGVRNKDSPGLRVYEKSQKIRSQKKRSRKNGRSTLNAWVWKIGKIGRSLNVAVGVSPGRPSSRPDEVSLNENNI